MPTSDLFQEKQARLTNFEVEEKAGEAAALLNNPVFQEALNTLYSKASGRLLEADVGSLTATAAHAMMKSIVDLKAQFQEFVDDNKVRQKYNKGDK